MEEQRQYETVDEYLQAMGMSDLTTECRRLESIARQFLVVALECGSETAEQWRDRARDAAILEEKIYSEGETENLKDDLRMLQDDIRKELGAIFEAMDKKGTQ